MRTTLILITLLFNKLCNAQILYLRQSNKSIIHYTGEASKLKTTIKKIDSLENQPLENTSNSIEIPKQKKNTYLASVPSIYPLNNMTKSFFISSFYKMRKHPILGKNKLHNGIDLAAKEGTLVYATADGVISNLYFNDSSIGFAIKIKHQHNYQTLYGHLLQMPVYNIGDSISRGDIIGYVGSTGLSTAPHLHYSIYYKKKAINPLRYTSLINE